MASRRKKRDPDVAANTASPPNDGTSEPAVSYSEERIRSLAYELYKQRNGAQGDELADWIRAEQLFRRGMGPDSASDDTSEPS